MPDAADRLDQVTSEQVCHWGSKQKQNFCGMVIVEGRWKWAEEGTENEEKHSLQTIISGFSKGNR